MKSIVFFVLLIGSVLSLAACSSAGSDNVEATTTQTTTNNEQSNGMMGMGGGMMARHHASIPNEYAGLTNPIPADDASIERGGEIYITNCASCHGDGGMGDGTAAAGLDPRRLRRRGRRAGSEPREHSADRARGCDRRARRRAGRTAGAGIAHRMRSIIAANAQLLYDKFQNIRLRATPAVGAGFQLIATYVVDWKLELAPLGYQYLSLLEPAANVRNPQHDGLMMFRMFADIDITDDIELLLTWRTNLVYTTIGNTNHLARLDFSLRITTILYFNTAFLYLRTEEPFPRSDATVPEKNDYQLVVGISLRIG